MPSIPRKEAGSKNHAAQKNNEQVLPHTKIPHADIDWALQQSPTVLRLWVESWRVDSFGTSPSRKKPQWHDLKTKFQGDNFRKAKKVIEEAGLFIYRKTPELIDGIWTQIIQCVNLHGYYSGFWSQTENLQLQIVDLPEQTENLHIQTENPLIQTENLEEIDKTTEQQDFQDSQLLIDNLLTPPLSLTNVIEEEYTTPVAITQPPFEEVAAMATDDIDLEEKSADTTPCNVAEDINAPLVTSDVAAPSRELTDADVERFKKEAWDKLLSANAKGGSQKRKVHIGQFMRSQC